MENQIQPQPYWADFKIKVGLYAKQEENGETKRVLIDPKDIQFKFTYKDAKDNQLVASYDGTTRVNHKIEDPSENSILVFNVDFNNGNITLYTIYNLNQILPYIPLEIGDSDEVKSKNKKNLSIGGHFFTQIDYGFGVGTYNSANGGFAHITTAYGNEVFYNISSDGAVSKNEDYIKPNMPFSITIESDIINTTISDDVLISNIKECGEIIVKGTNGLVEFNKTADSTTSILYFLNIRKDKTFQVLQFDTTSNQLTSTIIQ